MKLSVLVDNNTLIDRYFIGEPGLSFFIEEESKKILFDFAYSNAFIINAQKLKINLLDSDYLILSHGHLDHSWGLEPLIRLYTEAIIESIPHTKPVFLAHPDVFKTKSVDGIKEIGCLIPESKLEKHFTLALSKDPVWLTDRLVFLGEIERNNEFENQEPLGYVHTETGKEPDYLIEDTALAFKGKKGLTIITACSHSGICNIVEYAKKVCQEDNIYDIIGGFHLLNPSQRQLSATLDYLEKQHLYELHPCHCVDLKSKLELSKVINCKEIGAGLTLSYE